MFLDSVLNSARTKPTNNNNNNNNIKQPKNNKNKERLDTVEGCAV